MPVRSSVRFTDDYIKSLKPTASRYELYDVIHTGFGIRVSSFRSEELDGRSKK